MEEGRDGHLPRPGEPTRNLRLIVNDPELAEAHADFRAAREAERLGLIDPATREGLCSRASRRIAQLERGR